MYSVGPSIIDTIRREVIRTLTAWSGLHAATTNFLRHLARSFTAKAPVVLFTGFSMRLVDPSTPTLVLTGARRWKAFLPCNRSALFFLFFISFFRERKKNLVFDSCSENISPIAINGQVFKWKIED